ncbi:MAG TPA: fasciclin [Cytophagales bacterium]|nr:fasciclin [Cytophagales bacterium]HAA23174.1 fasciclin [Cytophagales bacterium]HAP59080.1 fasciclin [Cytophagales bacterium]
MQKRLISRISALLLAGLAFAACDNEMEEEELTSVVSAAQDDADLSTLVTALTQADLVGTLSDDNGTFTVFAPTNAAFTAAGIDLTAISDEDLTAVLTYHVLNAQVLSTELTAGEVATLNGAVVTVDLTDGVMINDATVVEADITTDNGVIHKIDRVLMIPEEEEPSSIVDVAVAASTAAEPQFTALVAALSKVQNDPEGAALLDVLGNLEEDFTVFAPTDAAFAALLDFLGAASVDEVETSLLQDVLLYHVVTGSAITSDILASGRVTSSLAGQTFEVDATALTIDDAGTIDATNIVAELVDITADNGVIHGIDKVILPARSIMDLVNFNEEFSTLKAALETAELTGTLADLEADFTVFAPTNDAFASYLDFANISAADLLASPALADILLYHVVGGTVLSTDLSNGFVETVNGQAVRVDLSDGVGIIDVLADYDDATVAVANLTAGNGVVHIIDEVLVPETANDVVDLAIATPDLSTLVDLIDNYPDLLATLQGDDANFTVFAPTNAAFEAISEVTETLTADQILEVLQYHVISGERVFSTDLSDALQPAMVNTETITINIGADGTVTISDQDANNTDATVTATDVQGINGVVHIINQVLIPEL